MRPAHELVADQTDVNGIVGHETCAPRRKGMGKRRLFVSRVEFIEGAGEFKAVAGMSDEGTKRRSDEA